MASMGPGSDLPKSWLWGLGQPRWKRKAKESHPICPPGPILCAHDLAPGRAAYDAWV
jgi:hypothetical protein